MVVLQQKTIAVWYPQRPADGRRANGADIWYTPRPIPQKDKPLEADKRVPGLLYPAFDCKDQRYPEDFRTRHYTLKALRRRHEPDPIIRGEVVIPEWGDYHWDEKDVRAEMTNHNAWTDMCRDR